jgi:hypothetical protein
MNRTLADSLDWWYDLTMDSAVFEQLEHTLTRDGPAAAVDHLCKLLREKKDYSSLFYALLMKKRQELGVCPVPTEPAQVLPESAHAVYEEAIREAARTVGQLYLGESDIPHAWMYYRMIGEPEPVAEAIENYQFKDGEDAQQVIEIAFHHGVHPKKGFNWILERYGICSAITTVTGQEFSQPETRIYCIEGLVRALYDQLRERLVEEVSRREGAATPSRTVSELIGGRDWLFEDEFYHVDVSHLSAVVQMSIHLHPGPELNMARELCAYGQRLSPRFKYASEPPFDDQYRDYGIYLSVLAGDAIEEGIAHFRAKAESADPNTVGTFPAEVLVNLLVRLNRLDEALAVARRHLTGADNTRPSCPSIAELCRQTNNYRTLAEVAREQGDPVHFLAGLLAAGDVG